MVAISFGIRYLKCIAKWNLINRQWNLYVSNDAFSLNPPTAHGFSGAYIIVHAQNAFACPFSFHIAA